MTRIREIRGIEVEGHIYISYEPTNQPTNEQPRLRLEARPESAARQKRIGFHSGERGYARQFFRVLNKDLMSFGLKEMNYRFVFIVDS